MTSFLYCNSSNFWICITIYQHCAISINDYRDTAVSIPYQNLKPENTTFYQLVLAPLTVKILRLCTTLNPVILYFSSQNEKLGKNLKRLSTLMLHKELHRN